MSSRPLRESHWPCECRTMALKIWKFHHEVSLRNFRVRLTFLKISRSQKRRLFLRSCQLFLTVKECLSHGDGHQAVSSGVLQPPLAEGQWPCRGVASCGENDPDFSGASRSGLGRPSSLHPELDTVHLGGQRRDRSMGLNCKVPETDRCTVS